MLPRQDVARVTILGLVMLTSAPAWAQDTIVEGQGIALGEGTVLHTNVEVEGGMDSNVFYSDASPVVAPILRLVANAAVASQHNQGGKKGDLPSVDDEERTITGTDIEAEDVAPDWDFRLGVRAGYDQYIGVGYTTVTNDSTSEQSNLSGGADVHVVRNPQGTLSFFVDDNLVRDTRPRNFISYGDLNRWNNHFQIGARYRPGGGALDFSLRYENELDRFDDKPDAVDATLANRMNHLLRLRAEWQFLPITRFFFDGSFGLFGPLGGQSAKVSSMPLRLQLGVASLITERTTARAHVGFAKGFYSAGPEFMMAVFGGELGLRYSPVGRFTIAYEYDFHDSINANFYRDHAIVGKVDHQFARFLLDVGAQLRLRGYRGVLVPMAGPAGGARDDLIIALHAKVHYLTRDWLAFTGALQFVSDNTAYVYMGDNPSYTRAEVIFGALAAF